MMVTRIDAETELTRQTRYQDFEPFAFRFKSKELVRRRNGEHGYKYIYKKF